MCSTFAAEGEMIAAREKLVRGGAGLTNEDLEKCRCCSSLDDDVENDEDRQDGASSVLLSRDFVEMLSPFSE